jgi:DNA-binding MarR family transcriptional regulator
VDDFEAAGSSAPPGGPQAGAPVPDGLVTAIKSSIPFGHAVGFLVSQLGYAVTRRFRADLESLSLEPRHFGLMRALGAARHLSQQALGESLHIPASSIVALLDQLEAKGFVRRQLDPADRRVRLVELTEAGQAVLARAVEIGIVIEAALCEGFDARERESLIDNLQKVASNIGLTLGVHPGFREDETDAGRRRRPLKDGT